MNATDLFKKIADELPGIADHAIASLVLAQTITDFSQRLHSEPIVVSQMDEVVQELNQIASEIDAGTTQITQGLPL